MRYPSNIPAGTENRFRPLQIKTKTDIHFETAAFNTFSRRRPHIVKDQYQFILHHRVMQHETDDQIAIAIIKEVQYRFPSFSECSFDKGFHSPRNQTELAEMLDSVVLPRKGKLSAINQEIENSEAFKSAKRRHSAIESAINALENHGLDRCPDHGVDGFKRYVTLAVVARNIQIIGSILQQKEVRKLARDQKTQRLAA